MATALPNNPNQECSICFESFKTPKILTCGHSFCLECLVRYIDGKKGSFSCPFCKQDVEIPQGGVNRFVTNFFLQTSMDTPPTTDISTTQPSNSLKPTTQTRQVSTTFKPKHYCPNHSQKEVEYYCQTCSLGLCSKCIYRDHKDHKTLDLECDSTREKVVQELSKSEQVIKNKIKDLEKTHATLLETSEKLKSFCDEACNKIGEKTETIIGELKENCEKKQNEIRDNFDKSESQLSETRQKVLTQIKNIETDLDTSCTTTEEPSLTLIYSLTKLQDLQKLCENMKTDIPPVTYVEWREGSVNVCDILGSTVTKPLYQSSEGSGPISTVTKLLYQSGEGSGPISTVTKPLNKSSEGSGIVLTVTKPLYQSKKGNIFKFNYKDIKTGLGLTSKDKYTSLGMVWSCLVIKGGSYNRYLYMHIQLEGSRLAKSCKIRYTLILLNKDKDKNISKTTTESITYNGERNLSIPFDKLTDPSKGFIDNRGQFLVKFEILQVLDTEYIYGRYDVKM